MSHRPAFAISLLLIGLAALPAFAADDGFEVEFVTGNLYSAVGGQFDVRLKVVPSYYIHPVTVSYSWVFPSFNPTPTTGTVTIGKGVPTDSFLVNVPRPSVYSGQFQGTVKISYTSGAGVPTTKTRTLYAQDRPVIELAPQAFVEKAGVVHVKARFDRTTSAPLCVDFWTSGGTAALHHDYEVADSATLMPGSREVDIPITILPDTLAEGVETFDLRPAPCSDDTPFQSDFIRMKIYDADLRATLTPDQVVAFTGDPLTLKLTLPRSIDDVSVPFRISSSNRAVLAPLDTSLVARGLAYVPVLTIKPGEATISASFTEWDALAPAVATIRTYYGTLHFGANDRVTVSRDDAIAVPVRMIPPPPMVIRIPIASANEAIATADQRIEIGPQGTGTLVVTGVRTGTTHLEVHSPGGRPISQIEVEVVQPLLLFGGTPASGSSVGGTAVTVTGDGFRAPCSVKFGETDATGITIVNETTMVAISPAHPVGNVDLNVTCQGTAGRLVGAFTFQAARKRSVRH